MADSPLPTRLTHRSSRRVTAGIGFHSFLFSDTPPSDTADPSPVPGQSTHAESSRREAPVGGRPLRPTQNITLQFPEDLDPAGGKHGMSVADRRCTFTPCLVDPQQMSILTRHGRITGLLGLPRPYQTLTAEVVAVGGGFAAAALDDASVCIAGGTGIAPFLTLDATSTNKLCWSVRSDDFGAVQFVLQQGLLKPEAWQEVSIFVTSGEDAGGVVGEQPASWWASTFTSLRQTYAGDRLSLWKRRMAAEDIAEESAGSEKKTVLFCGSKSLEWQVRLWAMNAARAVHCTEVE